MTTIKQESYKNQKEDAIREAMRFRIQHDQFEFGGLGRGQRPSAKVTDPHRLDKLLRKGIINENQHWAGMHFYTLHCCVNRSEFSLNAYTGLPQEEFAQKIFRELGIVGKIAATDLYRKIGLILPKFDYGVVFGICINELSAYELAIFNGFGVNRSTDVIRQSLDRLIDASEQARQMLEKALDEA